MKHAYVIGLGKSGIAASRLLKIDGWGVTLSDSQQTADLRQQAQLLVPEAIEVHLGESLSEAVATWAATDSPQLLVISPGVPWDLPALNEARALGVEVIGEAELAWRALRQIPWVGVTGTNGKTTTTALTGALFQQSGLVAPACGNIGIALCEMALAARQGQPLDWCVAELSSYQIEAAPTLAPRIGVWTTFTPDHLNRHKTLENYFRIKASLLDRSELQILNGDDPALRANGPQRYPRAWWTSTLGRSGLLAPEERGIWIEEDWVWVAGERIVAANALRMVGDHNRQNLLLAVGAARLAGIEAGAIAQGVAQFAGVPHRLEWVRQWQGIDLINDSKATNYDAAEVGLRAVPGPVVLIAGGDPKQGDDRAWLERIQQKAAAVVLIGVAAESFAARLAEVGYSRPVVRAETMDRAIPEAAALAQQLGACTVLLSPACASFDQYPNFEARGDHFRHCCEQLAEPVEEGQR